MSEAPEEIPAGWEKRTSRSTNMVYYLNLHTKESQWEPPTAPATESSSKPEIAASHLLIKHKDSRKPSSWREDNITRTKAEARKILEDFKAQIESGETTLAELAKVNSDCSSAKRGGDLGNFTRGQMQKPFEDASFDLKVGEMSDIISTDSGLHLIVRTN